MKLMLEHKRTCAPVEREGTTLHGMKTDRLKGNGELFKLSDWGKTSRLYARLRSDHRNCRELRLLLESKGRSNPGSFEFTPARFLRFKLC